MFRQRAFAGVLAAVRTHTVICCLCCVRRSPPLTRGCGVAQTSTYVYWHIETYKSSLRNLQWKASWLAETGHCVFRWWEMIRVCVHMWLCVHQHACAPVAVCAPTCVGVCEVGAWGGDKWQRRDKGVRKRSEMERSLLSLWSRLLSEFARLILNKWVESQSLKGTIWPPRSPYCMLIIQTTRTNSAKDAQQFFIPTTLRRDFPQWKEKKESNFFLFFAFLSAN